MRSLKIIVAEDEADMRDYLSETLTDLGHQVLSAVADGNQLVEACRSQQPDLVISDIKMSPKTGLEAAAELAETMPIPFILISAFHDQELLDRTAGLPVFGYLVKPIQRPHLITALTVAWQQFEQFDAVRQEAASLRQALNDRKLIERAKGILMKTAGIDEQQAFQRMQKLARNENRKMIDIAQSIITAAKALGTEDSLK